MHIYIYSVYMCVCIYIYIYIYISTAHKQHSPLDSYTWTHPYWLTSKNLNSTALCGHYQKQ